MSSATKRAAAGAAYLDRVLPKWHRKIDVHTLDINSTSKCVLGQLTGNYFTWTARALVPGYKTKTLGFRGSFLASYDGLKAAWIDEITIRLQHDAERARLRKELAPLRMARAERKRCRAASRVRT